MRPCASVIGATLSPDAAGGVWYPRILFRNVEKVAAARGLHRMSASIMVRLTEITLRSPCLCFSTIKDQRTSICLLRLRKRFSFERATADSQSSYMMVGWVCMNPSSLASLRKKIASCEALESAIISLSATFRAISGVFVLRHEIGPLLHMKSHPMELARFVLSCDLTSAKLASLQP